MPADSQASNDRSQIGLPDATDDQLKQLVKETPWFAADQDVYRVAVAVAIARDLQPKPNEPDMGYNTKFHVGAIDPDGKMKFLVSAFSPEHADAPYRWVQRLANKGVLYLYSALIEKGLPISEALGLPSREE